MIQRTRRNFQGSFCSCLLWVCSFPFLFTAAQHRSCGMAPVTQDFCTPAPEQPCTSPNMAKSISTACARLLHALLMLGSTTAPLLCSVSCRNHSTHGEGDWWLKCSKQDMDGDKQHSPSSFPISFSACLMAKNCCFFSGQFLQF